MCNVYKRIYVIYINTKLIYQKYIYNQDFMIKVG